jgi:NhaP-type Na+/H+ or K+/H+ antiporter
MYIGAVIPWDDFHQPDTSGITWPRLLLLGVLVLLFRRIPSTLALYKFMPKCCKNWREALFMGYFGPIGKSNILLPPLHPDSRTDHDQALGPSSTLSTPRISSPHLAKAVKWRPS